MNGWTPSIPLEVRVSNLIAQIPAEHRAPATKICYGKDDYEFERNLTSYVLGRVWEHPADVAFDLEAVTEAEQVAAEVASDNQWLDSDTSRNALPQINANGNLQWQGVEFDMSAIVERTKARSAALKSEIDKRMERAEQDWKQRKASVKLHSPKVIG